MSAARHRPRGFTLVEVMIAALILVVIVAGVVVAGNAQGRASATGARQRIAQAQGRGALLFLERKLALAGYGFDPVFGFDFGSYAGPCPAEMSPCPRDSVSNSDELVFHARNPAYWVPGDGNPAAPSGNAWNIRAATATTVTIAARAGNSFSMGQMVLAVCRGGNFYTVATIRGNVATLGADQDLTLDLQPAQAGDPFNRPDLAASPANGAACFSAGSARLFLVDRYRFHVRPVATGAGDPVPYLMLDQGIDRNRDGAIDANDELVVAEGVEDLQVGYVLANPALPVAGEGAPIVLGTAADGTVSSNTITRPVFPGGVPTADKSVYSVSAFYEHAVGPPLSQERLTDHQANIVAVRVAIVSRSPGTDRTSQGDTFQPLNRTSQPAWITGRQVNGRDGYQRALFETTVQLPNMTSTGLPYF